MAKSGNEGFGVFVDEQSERFGTDQTVEIADLGVEINGSESVFAGLGESGVLGESGIELVNFRRVKRSHFSDSIRVVENNEQFFVGGTNVYNLG